MKKQVVSMGRGLLFLMFLFSFSSVLSHPQAVLVENLTLNQYYNNTIINSSGSGFVQVITPTSDVLQYIRINLSTTVNTDLQSVSAYRATAASPNAGDRTFIYLNTSSNPQGLSYSFAASPGSFVNVDWVNLLAGGGELVPGSNLLQFVVRVNVSENAPASFNISFSRDSLGVNDSVNITDSSDGVVVDSDSDGFNDMIYWTGIVLSSAGKSVLFNVSVVEGVNWDGFSGHDFLDCSECVILNQSSLSGVLVDKLFSRSSVIQGVELLINPSFVRGFINNTSGELVYNVSSWDIYEVGNSTPLDGGSLNVLLNPGDNYYTPWIPGSTSAYYSSEFEWGVLWNQSFYENNLVINTYIPELLMIDSVSYKNVELLSNEASRVVKVMDSVQNIGTSKVNFSEITSDIPAGAEWSVSNVKAYYYNGSYTLISADVRSNQSCVLVNTTQELKPNDRFVVVYELSSFSSGVNQAFNFTSVNLVRTHSGTVSLSSAYSVFEIPASSYAQPSQHPVPGVPEPEKIVRITEITSGSHAEKNLARVSAAFRLVDTSYQDLSSVKVYVYLFNETELNVSSVKVGYYDSALEEWYYDSVIITGKGDGAYLVERIGADWFLKDSDLLVINYTAIMSVPGVNEFRTEVFGYNTYYNKIVSGELVAYTVFLEEPEKKVVSAEPLIITESDFVQGEAVVGMPVSWFRNVTVYNPNGYDVSQPFFIDVFPDSLSVSVEDERASLIPDRAYLKAAWTTIIPAGGFKIFQVQVFTPPIIERSQYTSVAPYNATTVRMITVSQIENTAMENYHDIVYNLKTRVTDVFDVRDDSSQLNFSKLSEGISINIPLFNGLFTKRIQVSSLEYPPVITISSSRKTWSPDDWMDANISVITKDDVFNSFLEIELIGPLQDLRTVYADINSFSDVKAFEETNLEKRFSLSGFPAGEYLLTARFKRGYATLVVGNYYFTISGTASFISLKWAAVLAVLFFVVLFSLRKIVMVSRRGGRLIIPAQTLYDRGNAFLGSMIDFVKTWVKQRRKRRRIVQKPLRPVVRRKKKIKTRKASEEQKLLRKIDKLIKGGGNV